MVRIRHLHPLRAVLTAVAVMVLSVSLVAANFSFSAAFQVSLADSNIEHISLVGQDEAYHSAEFAGGASGKTCKSGSESHHGSDDGDRPGCCSLFCGVGVVTEHSDDTTELPSAREPLGIHATPFAVISPRFLRPPRV